MKTWRSLKIVMICCSLMVSGGHGSFAVTTETEYVTTTPVLADGVLYVASSTFPYRRGSLRAIDITGSWPRTLWDAAERMPLAGVGATPGSLPGSDPPDSIQRSNLYRTVFSNLNAAVVPLIASGADTLQTALGVESIGDAELLLHAVRGRRGGSLEQVEGTEEDTYRLWNISRSNPALVDRSILSASSGERDRVLYAGAEDGMLHAFFISRWNSDAATYLIDDPEGGTELWAYLPGSFLPHMKVQPLLDSSAPLAVHLDGSPLVRELFIDPDGDGQRRWYTILVASGTILPQRRSTLFAMDITDPSQPELLWEQLLPGSNSGRTRGLSLDRCGGDEGDAKCVYLTADFSSEDEASGIHALSLFLATGQLRWQFTSSYPLSGVVASTTPAVPALMDIDDNGCVDTLVFGDLVGQLWALTIEDGHAYGGLPVYVAPGGAAEPIGAGVTVQGRLAVFGTGGVEAADNNYQYSVYAVELGPGGGQLRWVYPLASGEKVWQPPIFDATGHLLFTTSKDYLSMLRVAERPTSGRLVALDREGREEVSRETVAANLGQVVLGSGVAVAVSLTGNVTQIGVASRLLESNMERGSVKVLSWKSL